MLPTNLDLDVLRTFVTGVDLGNFAKAAERLGRSQSAISLQLKKLEDRVGQTLFRKQGRHLALTEAGETMLGYARRMLDLNDEAVAALARPDLSGQVRVGMPQDFAESWLPGVLGRFARAHPRARVDARVDRNAALLAALDRGELDLALVWDDGLRPDQARDRLVDLPIQWIGMPGFVRVPDQPLPLALLDQPCLFRRRGLAALDKAGILWRVAFTSASPSGLWAAVAAGLGVTVRTAVGLPLGLSVLDGSTVALPFVGMVGLCLCRGQMGGTVSAVTALERILRETIPVTAPGRLAHGNAGGLESA